MLTQNSENVQDGHLYEARDDFHFLHNAYVY